MKEFCHQKIQLEINLIVQGRFAFSVAYTLVHKGFIQVSLLVHY